MRQPLFLGFLNVAQHRGGGGDRQRAIFEAERGQVVHGEELQQLAAAGIGVEQPRCAPAQPARVQHAGGPAVLVGHQRFRRLQARQLRFQRVFAGHFVGAQAAAGQVRPGQPVAPALAGHAAAADRQQQLSLIHI